MNRRELERLVDERVTAILAPVARRLDDAIAELRDDVHEELAALDHRVTTIHAQALRALTDQLDRRNTEWQEHASDPPSPPATPAPTLGAA